MTLYVYIHMHIYACTHKRFRLTYIGSNYACILVAMFCIYPSSCQMYMSTPHYNCNRLPSLIFLPDPCLHQEGPEQHGGGKKEAEEEREELEELRWIVSSIYLLQRDSAPPFLGRNKNHAELG